MKVKTLGALLILAGAGQAQAAGWDDLGGILNQACRVNNVGGVPIDTGENLRWLCQLRSMHAFITDNIINGDWSGFAKDVVGKYASDYLSQLGEFLGTGALNAYTDQLNEALKGEYAGFRNLMYGAVNDIMRNRREVNAGMGKDTAGGIAATAISSNPNLTLSNRTARLQDAIEASAGLEAAYRAKKAQEEAAGALEANTAPALAAATEVVGVPGQEGRADRFVREAATAVSNREVAELQVRLDAERTKQDATMMVALLNQLGEMVQQQVMTNNTLMLERQRREEEMLSNEEELNREIETLAQENVDAAVEQGKAVMGAYAGASVMLGSGRERLDFSEVAP